MLEYLQKASEPSRLKRLTAVETSLLESVRTSSQAGCAPPTVSADADGYFLLPQVKPGAPRGRIPQSASYAGHLGAAGHG